MPCFVFYYSVRKLITDKIATQKLNRLQLPKPSLPFVTPLVMKSTRHGVVRGIVRQVVVKPTFIFYLKYLERDDRRYSILFIEFYCNSEESK
jgi:hypothetical protein